MYLVSKIFITRINYFLISNLLLTPCKNISQVIASSCFLDLGLFNLENLKYYLVDDRRHNLLQVLLEPALWAHLVVLHKLNDNAQEHQEFVKVKGNTLQILSCDPFILPQLADGNAVQNSLVSVVAHCLFVFEARGRPVEPLGPHENPLEEREVDFPCEV